MSDQILINALQSIIIRCEEGDKRTNWLPTIADINNRRNRLRVRIQESAGNKRAA